MLQLRYADYWLSAGMHEQKLRAQHVLRPKAEPERLLMLRDYPYKLLWISYFFCLISVINFHSLRWSAQLITRRLCTPSAWQIYIINNINANFSSKSFHFLPIFPLFYLYLSPQFFIFIPLFCELLSISCSHFLGTSPSHRGVFPAVSAEERIIGHDCRTTQGMCAAALDGSMDRFLIHPNLTDNHR